MRKIDLSPVLQPLPARTPYQTEGGQVIGGQQV